MNHEEILFETDFAGVGRFTHSCNEPHIDPREELCSQYSINFTEKDCFSLFVGKDEWLMTSDEIFFTRPNLIFHCKHREEIPQDVCFSVFYAKSFVEEIRVVADLHPKNERTVLKLTNHLSYLHWRLAQIISQDKTRLAIENLFGDLFLAAAYNGENKSLKLFSKRQRRYYFEHMAEICRILESRYNEEHSLGEISQHVGMSPFHFARVFKEIVGIPPHKYLLRTRLKQAKELLQEGSGVTEACFAVGFTNLSHFVRSFSRHFGISPSKVSPKRKYIY